MDNLALILVIIGAINWGSIGLFGFDLVGSLFGGQGSINVNSWAGDSMRFAFVSYAILEDPK